jgi:hypothetical protein
MYSWFYENGRIALPLDGTGEPAHHPGGQNHRGPESPGAGGWGGGEAAAGGGYGGGVELTCGREEGRWIDRHFLGLDWCIVR